MGGYYEEKNFMYNDEYGNGSIFICRVRYRFRKVEFCVRYQQDKRSWNNNQCSCY